MASPGATTVPNTPQSFNEDVLAAPDQDVFAWIRPSNGPAHDAYDAALNAVITRPDEFRHARQFFSADGRYIRQASILTDDGDLDRPVEQWNGRFKLSLQTLPQNPAEGWSIGTREVDILLAPRPRKRKSWRLAGKHARIFFHKESGRIMIEAHHTITISGADGQQTFTAPTSRVVEDASLLSIGDCLYIIEYTEFFKTSAFQESLCYFMREHGEQQWSLHACLLSASAGKTIKFGEYTCSQGAFAQGTFGQISAGWARDGRTVAIKRFKHPDLSELRAHEAIMTSLGRHPNILTFLDCITSSDMEIPSAYCVYAPLAIGSLEDVLKSHTIEIRAKATLFADYLRGLAYMHQNGVMHRDINPKNLGVASLNPPSGIILDLDSASNCEKSNDHMKGTLPYLAPEIVALKKWAGKDSQPPAYTESVDVWALGLSMFVLETGSPIIWNSFMPRPVHDVGAGPQQRTSYVTKEAFFHFDQRLQHRKSQCNAKIGTAYLANVEKMTRWDVDSRVGAAQLLEGLEMVMKNVGKGSITVKRGLKRGLDE